MDLGISGKVALVTAASSGLGKAIALCLSAEGAQVMICSRNKQRILAARDDIAGTTGNPVRGFVADVTDAAHVSDMVQEIGKEFAGVDILVCNAGGPPAGMHEEFSPDDYRRALELNLLSTISLCYAVLPHMKQQKWGRIIAMTSISAKQPLDRLILSNTSRAGVLGFTKSLANQVAAAGITVNALCPGYTKTRRVENLAKAYAEAGKGTIADFYAGLEKDIPARRIGTPGECAQTAAFLASRGAGYITGVALQVDGGYVKGLF